MTVYIQKGHFAFFEYSIVNWAPHLLARMSEDSANAFHTLSGTEIDTFLQTLVIFLDVQWVKPKKKSRVPASVVKAVKLLSQLETGHKAQLLQTLASMNGLTSSDLQEPSSFESLRLYSILRKVRARLEALVLDPRNCDGIKLFYGPSIFKCPRLYCKRFYDGFESAAKRDDHVSKHERAYYCSYIGCAHAKLGLTSADELEKHYQQYHKLLTDEFPPEPTPAKPSILTTPGPAAPTAPATNTPAARAASSAPAAPSPAQRPVMGNKTPPPTSPKATNQPAKRSNNMDASELELPPKRQRPVGPFTCEVCSKVFVRYSHLRSHTRTHTDERPFACKLCAKSFARQPDLTRHEALHNGNRKFTCRGTLRNGRPWGCGKKFARADGLARHYKGQAGELCIKPLRDEEKSATHQQRADPSRSASTTICTGSSQPTSLNPYQLPPVTSDAAFTGWRELPPLPQSQPGTYHDPFFMNDDDPFPMALYDQFPALTGFNWDNLAPEQQ